jgi:hypothetical protein
MRLHKYKSYRQYARIQKKKNARCIDRTWATPAEMQVIADHVRAHLPDARFALCHGAKHGWEVEELRARLGIEVLGTDISPSAAKFAHVVQWDFHEVKDEWIGRADFIYSNALDHSYDPDRCLAAWTRCLRPRGLLFIEWSEWHGEEHSTPDDPFGASLEEYRAMIARHALLRAELALPRDESAMYPLARTVIVAERPA